MEKPKQQELFRETPGDLNADEIRAIEVFYQTASLTYTAFIFGLRPGTLKRYAREKGWTEEKDIVKKRAEQKNKVGQVLELAKRDYLSTDEDLKTIAKRYGLSESSLRYYFRKMKIFRYTKYINRRS